MPGPVAIKRGSVLLKCQPYAHVVLNSKFSVLCNYCLHHSRCDLKKCSKCKVVQYCSATCQRKDWMLHKRECDCLQKVRPHVPTDSVRLMLRLLIRQNMNHNNVKFKDDPGWRVFDNLVSHEKEIRNDEMRSSQFLNIYHTLEQMEHDTWQLPPGNMLMDIFGKMIINSFSIHQWDSLNAVGIGIYLSPSAIDHSCSPNCVVQFDGVTLYVKCISDIMNVSSNEIQSELRISYMDQLSLISTRQVEFQQRYYFKCCCSICSTQQDYMLLPIKCRNCDGKRYLKDVLTACDKCGSDDQIPFLNAKACLSTFDDVMSSVTQKKQDGDFETALELCESLSKQFSDVLHPLSLYYTKLNDESFDICIELGLWDKATIFGSQALQGFRLFYPDPHPATTLLLLKLGKVLQYIGDKEATMFLRQARDMAVYTHPPRLIEEINKLLVDSSR